MNSKRVFWVALLFVAGMLIWLTGQLPYSVNFSEVHSALNCQEGSAALIQEKLGDMPGVHTALVIRDKETLRVHWVMTRNLLGHPQPPRIEQIIFEVGQNKRATKQKGQEPGEHPGGEHPGTAAGF